MSTTKIILNPYASRWEAREAIPDVERACRRVGLDYDLVVTDGPGHGIELARDAARAGFSPIVAAGGDGSVNEVVNGLMRYADAGVPDGASLPPLGIIPLGTADDFAVMAGLETAVEEACRVIRDGHTRAIDLGCVNGHYFDNNSAVGLEPMVTITQANMARIKGTPRYILAAVKTIWNHQLWDARLTWDDGEYEGRITLVSVGNTRRTGGAFYMTPHAEMDDGYLDFVYVGEASRLRLLRLLPTTFNGSHIDQPEVTYLRTTRLTIDCDPPTPIQADGEVFELSATHIEYTILPGQLEVIVPSTAQKAGGGQNDV